MKCSRCGRELYSTMDWVLVHEAVVGECCYFKLLESLRVVKLTDDKSLLYDFDGDFIDEGDQKRYHITKSVVAGRGNMGYSARLKIQKL